MEDLFMNTNKIDLIKTEVEKLHGNPYYMMAVKDVLAIIDSLQEEPVSEELFEASAEYAATGEILANGKEMIDFQKQKAFIAGAEWKFERVKEALLSEVLPCFMHSGEADEVVVKLDEVLNQKK